MENKKKVYKKPQMKIHGNIKQITNGAGGRISEGSQHRSH